MKSIRKRLILWLLLGLSVLWAAAGAGIYYSVHRSELTRLDAQLDKMEGVARYIIFTTSRGSDGQPRPNRPDRPEGANPDREGREDQRHRRPEERWPDFFETTGTSFFQVWDGEKKSRRKSESLGEREFKFPADAAPDEPLYYNATLADGTELRAKATLLRPPAFGRPRGRPSDPSRRPGANTANGGGNNSRFTSLVALDRSGMNESLASLLWGIAGVGIAAALASITLIHFALKDGLKPLRRLGDQLAEIDAQSLDGRFSSKDLPVEILPVSDRFNELMGRLEKSFERERRFSADLAHELRTPVAELRTMSEVALRWPDGKDPEEAKATLEIAEQMGGIIESLLALARYENGQTEIEPELVSLPQIVSESWEGFATHAKERGVDVALDLPEDSTVETDPKLLRLILNNLFSNASEYTPEGGQIQIAAATGNNGTLIEVANSAPELDAESVDHLFERFWRRDGARSDNSHSGLGLSLARACAKAIKLDLHAELGADGKLVIRLAEIA